MFLLMFAKLLFTIRECEFGCIQVVPVGLMNGCAVRLIKRKFTLNELVTLGELLWCTLHKPCNYFYSILSERKKLFVPSWCGGPLDAAFRLDAKQLCRWWGPANYSDPSNFSRRMLLPIASWKEVVLLSSLIKKSLLKKQITRTCN